MRIAGNAVEDYDFILYVAFAILAAINFCFQAMFEQKMKIPPVYFVLIVSVCKCYENSILAAGSQVHPDGAAAQIMYAIQALEIPLLMLVLYETAYVLYEEKGANLAIVQVEERSPRKCTLACTFLWLMRFVALCLLVLNILINYQLIPNQDYMRAGSAGYVYLAKHSHSLPVWLALVPPIVLSIVGLLTGVAVARYGSAYTIGLSHLYKWKVLIAAALAQAVGQVFGADVYPVTSNAGEMALLIGATFFLYLAQDDLILTAHFADFLHQSNAAFSLAEGNRPDTWAHHHEARRRPDQTELNTAHNSHISANDVEMVLVADKQSV